MEKNKIPFIKRIIKQKRTWVIFGIIVIILGYFIFRPSNNAKNTITEKSSYIDLKETVLATGQVTSSTDLSLSFNSSGVVKSIKVKVGDKVKEGQILATLDQGSELASLTSARGALAGANARLKRTIEGASNEEISLSQITLDQTKITQDTLINNAYQNLLNSTPEAVPLDGKSDYTAPAISGTYSLGKEGKIYVKMYYSQGGRSFTLSGLAEGTGEVDTITPQPLGASGLYIKFSDNGASDVSDWVIEIPNKKASDYLTNYNAYQSTLTQAKATIDQRTAELALKKAQARTSDIELAQADIISAEGQLQLAQSKYDNTIIKAPSDGTITKIDVKVGELTSALKQAMVLQDISNIYLEANINEANIASVSIGMPIDITFDAFGSDKIFDGHITKIDPSSTVSSGVVNYKITANVEQVSDIRPGMTANMTIKIKEKDHVLAVPSRAILVNKEGVKSIRIVTNTKTKKYKESTITTGIEGDGGLTEVTSGLLEGEEYIVLIKSK
jgi:HlyD family secretion protein